MKLKVYASLSEDSNNGWIWLPDIIINKRAVLKLQNLDNNKSVYCEALPIGENFLRRYKLADTVLIENQDKIIVMNEWYREKLCITSTQVEHNFRVKKVNNPYGHIKASLDHPQIVVRLAMELAVIGFVLGIVGLALGIIGIWK